MSESLISTKKLLKKLTDRMGGLVDAFYPVGSIIMSTDNTNPSSRPLLAGTTWVAWGSGRVPVGVDTTDSSFDVAEKAGGSKTVTLTTEQIPAHKHYEYGRIYTGAGDSVSSGMGLGGTLTTSYLVQTDNAGGGQAHSNVQPYITCYMWKRTA